jgi:hypothetical protein
MANTHAIHALVANSAGKIEEYKASHQAAVASLAAVQNPEDRAVVMKTFNLISKI